MVAWTMKYAVMINPLSVVRKKIAASLAKLMDCATERLPLNPVLS